LTAAAVLPLAVSFAGLGSAAQASGKAHASPAVTSTGPGIGDGGTGLAAGVPLCKQLGKTIQASSGAQAYCFGAQAVGKISSHAVGPAFSAPGNADAASFSEDVNPAGVRAFGQSETSVAAQGQFVVEAWNDSTGFFSRCGSKGSKEELTGIGFSTNGGKSFKDLGGLRNPGCNVNLYAGDPSVTAYRVGNHTFFYVASLYLPARFFGMTHIAFDSCEVMGSGSSATLHCFRPVVAASSTQCFRFRPPFSFCSFLDKDFTTIDPVHHRLYVSYSEFPVIGRGGDPERMTVCDLGSKSGGTGPAGGTPSLPVCEHGTPLVQQPGFRGHLFEGKPYFTVAGGGAKGCENEGSYPAVNVKTGSVYVGYEANWATNIFDFNCVTRAAKTRNDITNTPFHCLRLAPTAACALPATRTGVNVFSMDAAFIPGYNRFPMNDFPRLAVSPQAGTVSMVWNDARFHPNGDILLQSFKLGTLQRVQQRLVVLDQPHGAGFTFLPALRTATSSGLLDVSWYSRSSTGTANTGVTVALGVNPRGTATPRNVMITNKLSNWLVNNSDIVPNFGDYTDAAVNVLGRAPWVGNTLYVAWSDGRSGVPQPFEAHIQVH
jgi:hypothetical protein